MNNPKDEQKGKEKIITVDANKCIGCGLCVPTCPDVFELGEDGKSQVKDPSGCAMSTGRQAKCNCQQALDNCPAKAISWSE